MPASTPPLHCADCKCQAANPSDRRFCQQCNAPLVRRYLWAIGDGIAAYPVATAIADRYFHLQARLFLDTQPGKPPHFPTEIPTALAPYLSLFYLRPHVPQLYGQLPAPPDAPATTLYLLESGLFSRHIRLTDGEILPALATHWAAATPIRQLNWLWQMASLWSPFAKQGVASSLLVPEFLRVDNATLQLRELQLDDPESPPELSQLGLLWQDWLSESAPSTRDFLKGMSRELADGHIQTSQALIARLDRAIATASRRQTRHFDLFACTDTGRVRQHNEDACYPDSGKLVTAATQALAIVCDGIGGHEGGEIASQLAIAALRAGVQPLTAELHRAAPPAEIRDRLELSTCKANDLISDRNDSEQRQERRRMGTTLVMALSQAHEMYLTHVGDSRIYLISADSCQQLTLDDDLASRSVRLGASFYRAALTNPSAGALIQALGMSHSSRLRPTVTRLVLDRDCVFLLCSDGLSDRDRVEQYWETEILPILQGGCNVRTAGERLLEIANQRNGHDNITIALVHCQVRDRPQPPPEIPQPQLAARSQLEPTRPPEPAPSPEPKSDDTWPGWTLAVLAFVGLMVGLGGLSYFSFPEVRARVDRWLGRAPVVNQPEPLAANPVPAPPPPAPIPTAVPTVVTPAATPLDEALLGVGNWLAAREAIALHAEPTLTATTRPVPADSLFYISQRQVAAEGAWVQLQVCLPAATAPTPAPTAETIAGWLPTDTAVKLVEARRAETIPTSCREATL